MKLVMPAPPLCRRAFATSSQMQTFAIYRYDPEQQAKPFLQEYSVTDFFYDNFLHSWARDAQSFQFVLLTMLAMGIMVAQCFRMIFWIPDCYCRRQEIIFFTCFTITI